MASSLRIARVAGIDLKVHWSFALVPVMGAVQWGGLGTRGAVFGAVLIATMVFFPQGVVPTLAQWWARRRR